MDVSSTGSVCGFGAGNCNSTWTLTCFKGASWVLVYGGTGDNVTWTSGNGGGFTIDTRNLTAPMPCNVTLNLTHASDTFSEAAAQFKVLPNPPAADISSTGTQVVARDINGDGRPDIIVGNKHGVYVFTHRVKTVSAVEFEAAQPKLARP